ncbi:MAG: hypothetical protein HYY66_09580 [Candidatus Tectomicrobia bacterium]|nr:hypothetical protein [Candidatus Tectomicrobia bacterium]
MSEPIGIVGFEKPASPPARPPAGGAGDFGFSDFLDAAGASAEGGEPRARALPSSVTAYNSLNLLNGKFPPPDSGAGFIFTVVAIMNEEAA